MSCTRGKRQLLLAFITMVHRSFIPGLIGASWGVSQVNCIADRIVWRLLIEVSDEVLIILNISPGYSIVLCRF